MISTILVYGLLWGFVGPDQQKITHADALVFSKMGFISLGVGGLCSLIFHILVRNNTQNQRQEVVGEADPLVHNDGEDPSLHRSLNDSNNDEEIQSDNTVIQENITQKNSRSVESRQQVQRTSSIHEIMNIKDWLLEPQTYQVACVYMSARLFVNITQTYIPLYIQETLELKALNVALIPIIMYVSGFVVSLIIKPITMRIGRKFMFVIACLIGLVGCLLMNPGNT